MSVNFTGTWKANFQKSKWKQPGPKEMRMRITHSEPRLTVEMFVTNRDGKERRIRFRASTSKIIMNSLPHEAWRTRLFWIGRELLFESWVKMGERESHFRDYWSLSDDGETLRMEHRGDRLAGQLTVLERQRD